MTTRSARACPSGGDATARRVTLVIPGKPAYALSPNSRCHWRVKHRETEAAGWNVRAALANRVILQFNRPVRLHWTVYLAKGGKRRDTDNALASMKAHQDYLVRFGVLTGDSPTCIPETPTVEQIVWSKHRGEPKITVTIEEAA